ncbi:hypothetical protein Pmar_PMAR020620 [Perkinsus marinus ATCC 50983]|uniref:Uncharacterized protein n=1 Tax=Perkinsus marinus (strain ATCC 50983 / TXsc) TaxID=423536 RepID=C5L7J6_PERM5|nr:hypothetical protein Pmar_PMAR020620 [Perkinsus marinus ATCC 50983]EER07458.1 hypothetical protein Pmar_PMAR020620 [Perkinsus marinus ATCC 50983]|eukprot:XP_002775642.1 hypothetical protein Pmar_PMAR020620 [Perkinsus marinus ATCC 50983]
MRRSYKRKCRRSPVLKGDAYRSPNAARDPCGVRAAGTAPGHRDLRAINSADKKVTFADRDINLAMKVE